MRRLRKFLELPRADRQGLLRAWLALQCAVVAIRLLPIQRVLRTAQGWRPRRGRRAGADPAGSLRLLNISARYTVGTASCLPRALALHALLCRDGIQSCMHLGVARHDDALAAHAWVEWDGGSTAGAAGGDYVALPQITQ
jgi:hypothetical protein